MSATGVRNRLYYWPRLSRFAKGAGRELPEAYKKFWDEWKREPTALHYIKEEEKYKIDETCGQPVKVQNVPLPLIYPVEFHKGIWGGEAIVKGYIKKYDRYRPTPKFWVPRLIKSVVYSEVLNQHIRTIITSRTIELIHENYGFDHYLLKTPACDLKSELALTIKRKILTALADKTLYPDDPVKREEIYNKYKDYLSAYTREEIEWYGYTFDKAMKKLLEIKRVEKENNTKPLKLQYRAELIEQLKTSPPEDDSESGSGAMAWLSKVNPFSKSKKEQ